MPTKPRDVVRKVLATYPGLDMGTWDDRMVWLWQRSNLRLCGFYLAHSPNDPGTKATDWLPHRHDMADIGWGIVPFWVPFKHGAVAQNMSAADATLHGELAVKAAQKGRLEKGAVIYLDLEDGGVLQNGAKTKPGKYVLDWMTAVQAGGYRPGIYLSHVDVVAHGILHKDFHGLRPAIFPFSIPDANRARFDRDTFTLPPILPTSWPVGNNRDWPLETAVVGCQYDWYNKDRPEKTFDWADARGRRDRRSARDVDWDAAKVFDPAHPRAAGTLAIAPDAIATDSVQIYVVRPTLIDASGRDRGATLYPSIDLELTPSDIGPTPSATLDGFDASGAAAVSRRTGHHDLFVLGMDGFIRTTWVNPRENHPAHPWPLNPRDPARKGSPLAAVSRVTDRIDIFYVERSHRLVTQWWQPTQPQWDRQRKVIDGPPVAGGSPLTAVPGPAERVVNSDRLDVFYITFDFSLPKDVGASWNQRWQLAHAAWTAQTDWRVRTLTTPGGAAAASGVAATRDAAGTLHAVFQRRDRTGLSHAMLVGSDWASGAGPGPVTASWWMNLQLITVGRRILLVGVTNEAAVAWASWSENRWSAVEVSPATFCTGRPLALAPRGPSIVDVIGLTEDGELVMRSLTVLADGSIALR